MRRGNLLVTAFLIVMLSALLQGCNSGKGETGGSAGGTSDDDPGDTNNAVVALELAYPYLAESPYADVLANCAFADVDALCNFSTLPLIGMTVDDVSVDAIMQRVLVTHDWMGKRFEDLLRRMPDEMLPLFASTRTVLIGSTVRQSLYHSWHAQINIDPNFLWLSNNEKASVDKERDNRTEYGVDLQFVSLWRFVQNNQYAFPFHSLYDASERTIDDIEKRFAALMFHELAHAVDYILPAQIGSIDVDLTPRELLDLRGSVQISNALYAEENGLSAQTSLLYYLARVRFNDEEADDRAKNITAAQVGEQFAMEGKANFYAHFSIAEDTATLFEITMMKKHYGLEHDVGFADKPPGFPDQFSCDELLVAWGRRDRLGADLLYPRALFVAQEIAGDDNPSYLDFFATEIGFERPLPAGLGWCDSVDYEVTAENPVRSGSNATRNAMAERLREEQIERALHLQALSTGF